MCSQQAPSGSHHGKFSSSAPRTPRQFQAWPHICSCALLSLSHPSPIFVCCSPRDKAWQPLSVQQPAPAAPSSAAGKLSHTGGADTPREQHRGNKRPGHHKNLSLFTKQRQRWAGGRIHNYQSTMPCALHRTEIPLAGNFSHQQGETHISRPVDGG